MVASNSKSKNGTASGLARTPAGVEGARVGSVGLKEGGEDSPELRQHVLHRHNDYILPNGRNLRDDWGKSQPAWSSQDALTRVLKHGRRLEAAGL